MNVSLIDGHIDGKKMSDEDIMKALECCATARAVKCHDCAYCGKNLDKHCTFVLTQDALDLLKRKDAEIEMMRNYIHDHNLEWDLLSYSKRNGG